MQIDDEDDSTEEEEEGDEQGAPFEGGYNPAEFESLPVSADIKELFQYIGRYTPQQVSLLWVIFSHILVHHKAYKQCFTLLWIWDWDNVISL